MLPLERIGNFKKIAGASWFLWQKDRQGNPKAWEGDAQGIREFSGAEALEAKKSAAAKGKWMQEVPSSWKCLPTGLDLQVHLRFPGQAHKETLEGGLSSAWVGGYDSLVSMPNTDPFLDNPQALELAIEASSEMAQQYFVKVGFAASATLGMKGEVATDILALAKAGAVAITDDGWGVKSPEAQEEIFARCAATGLLFQQHAEMPGHKGVATASEFQSRSSLTEYPRLAESQMIARDLEILRRQKKARYHVLHVSTRESLDLVRKAKEEGLNVTAEVTPHHLYFSNAEIPVAEDERTAYFKMNPPLFAPEDRAALLTALIDGVVDCVSTDHAPHENELKKKGWALAPFGTRGLETALPVLLDFYFKGAITWQRLLEVYTLRPREIIPSFGKPQGLLFVSDAPLEVTRDSLPGISFNSCFLGTTLKGRIEWRAQKDCVFARV